MKFICIILLTILSYLLSAQGIQFQNEVSIDALGTESHESAILDIKSNNKGLLVPRMSTIQYNAISNPAHGLLIYDHTKDVFVYYNGSDWTEFNFAIVQDKDGDTKIQVEESFNDDVIRFDIDGREHLTFKENPHGALLIDLDNFSKNTFLGKDAGAKTEPSTTVLGGRNTFYGYEAGSQNSTGFSNVFLGTDAGRDNTTGGSNSFIGHLAGQRNLWGEQNTFVGYASGERNTLGIDNTAIGFAAGRYNRIGTRNVFIGHGAGASTPGSSQSNCVFIGASAGAAETEDSRLYINNSASSAPLIYGEFDNRLLRIHGQFQVKHQNIDAASITHDMTTLFHPTSSDGSDNGLRIHNTGPNSNFWNLYTVNSNGKLFFYSKAGGSDPVLEITSTGVVNSLSDRNRKDNIEEINHEDILQQVGQLPITKWQYKKDSFKHIGPMAQDFYQLFGLGDSEKSIGTIDASGISLAAIKGLLSRYDQLQTQLKKQELVIEDLQIRLLKLENKQLTK